MSGGFLCYCDYFAMMQSQGSCKTFIPAFSARLSTIISADLSIQDYCKRYLDHLLFHSQYYLTIYADVLDKTRQYADKPASQVSLADFGAGNGLLGIFAKFCGFKKVFLCDVDADFIEAAQVVAGILNISIDGFTTGDIDKLQVVLKNETIDAMVGTDVVEHIYNLDDFFAGVKAMNNNMVTVFTTASNPDNFIKVRKLKKFQVKDEWVGGDPGDFVLAGSQKHEAFLVMREKIITSSFPEITAAEIKQLAMLTKGLKQEDILHVVKSYLTTGLLPVIKTDSTNTCHPITGSWTERILPIDSYRKIYAKQFFALEVHNGFYNAYSAGSKKYLNFIMNFLVTLTGRIAAPFITLIGFKLK